MPGMVNGTQNLKAFASPIRRALLTPTNPLFLGLSIRRIIPESVAFRHGYLYQDWQHGTRSLLGLVVFLHNSLD